MPELTLADVERLTKKAGPQLAEVEHWNDAMKNRVSNDYRVLLHINWHRFEAWRKLGEAVADSLPALLALAREALERRADRDLQAQADMARADWLEDERRGR